MIDFTEIGPKGERWWASWTVRHDGSRLFKTTHLYFMSLDDMMMEIRRTEGVYSKSRWVTRLAMYETWNDGAIIQRWGSSKQIGRLP